ncbi:MAG: hypothetical protein Rhirs2KO_12580 [Rhizobiaceae bacterium]
MGTIIDFKTRERREQRPTFAEFISTKVGEPWRISTGYDPDYPGETVTPFGVEVFLREYAVLYGKPFSR